MEIFKKKVTKMEKKIKDLFPEPYNHGIISIINSYDNDLESAFESIEGYDEGGWDLLYFQRSCDKNVANIVDYIQERYDEGTDNWETDIANMLVSLYKRKWLKLIDTYSIEYDALKPYAMSLHDELVRDHLTSRDVVNRTDNETENSTEHGEGTDSSSSHSEGSDTSTDSYFGFNTTTTPVDTNKTAGENAQDTSREGETSRDTTSERTNSRTGVRGDDYTRDRESERDITRSGNIGNKTNQELITEEREMLRWNVIIQIFSDIDKILCAKIW